MGNENQRVGVVARRQGDLDQMFARQIGAFSGAKTIAVNALVRNWVGQASNRPSRLSWGEVDFRQVYHQLKDAGLISGPRPWPALTEEQARAAAKRAGRQANTVFRPLENLPA